jgi:hypothetical protein
MIDSVISTPSLQHKMALSNAASLLRNTVLMHLRIPVSSASQIKLPNLSYILSRGYGGGFLERDSVVERVIYVAKHFEKVDPAKVRCMQLLELHFIVLTVISRRRSLPMPTLRKTSAWTAWTLSSW